MRSGTIVLIILGAALLSAGVVMALRSGKPIWWVAVVFGFLLLAAAAATVAVTTFL